MGAWLPKTGCTPSAPATCDTPTRSGAGAGAYQANGSPVTLAATPSADATTGMPTTLERVWPQQAALLAEAVLKCKADALKDYWAALDTRRTTRLSDLASLAAVDKADMERVVRCERAPGWREYGPEYPEGKPEGDPCGKADAGSCCGAAQGEVGGATLVVELCGKKPVGDAASATTFQYAPPREPMSTAKAGDAGVRDLAEAWPFRCLEQATRWAAGAAVAVAAVTLMQ